MSRIEFKQEFFNKSLTNGLFENKFFHVLLFMMFCTNVSLGQNIHFMGIPLGITYDSFKQQLLAKGFTYCPEQSNTLEYNNTYLFNGNFAGEVVGLSVCITPKSHIVYSVGVRFKGYAYSTYGTGVSEQLQIDKFNEIKNSICKKYSSIVPIEGGSEMFPKIAFWDSDKWTISLFIGWDNSIWKNLGLDYTDKEAENRRISEIESDY